MVTRSVLTRQLRALGLRPGALVMVHASLRRLGLVEGGAEGVLGALRDAIGEEGTLVMVLGADPRAPFDALRTPAEPDIGVLAEVFRQQPTTQVSDHAAARFGAAGPLAAQLLTGAPLHDYYGPGTLLARFTAAGGHVLRLGADPDTVTLTHHAEYLADLPEKRRVRIAYTRADTGSQWIECLDDTYGIVDWPAGDYFAQIWLDFRAEGRAATGPVGGCTAERFEAEAFVAFAVAWMERHLR